MDRPIIFSAPMVRALLDGRKTQTRRVLNPQPVFFDVPIDEGRGVGRVGSPNELWPFRCMGTAEERDFQRWAQRAVPPYAAGDRLWVRENWKAHSTFEGTSPRDIAPTSVFYAADDAYAPSGSRCRPSIHMPRWASRLTLAVTGVRVERLQDISHADAKAEGVTADDDPFWVPSPSDPDSGGRPSHRNSLEFLWNVIHGPEAWTANPWVAAISFTVHRANIDALDIGAAA